MRISVLCFLDRLSPTPSRQALWSDSGLPELWLCAAPAARSPAASGGESKLSRATGTPKMLRIGLSGVVRQVQKPNHAKEKAP